MSDKRVRRRVSRFLDIEAHVDNDETDSQESESDSGMLALQV
jgi:hypothetical protein